jgi:hypothetical protein
LTELLFEHLLAEKETQELILIEESLQLEIEVQQLTVILKHLLVELLIIREQEEKQFEIESRDREASPPSDRGKVAR